MIFRKVNFHLVQDIVEVPLDQLAQKAVVKAETTLSRSLNLDLTVPLNQLDQMERQTPPKVETILGRCLI